MRPRYPVRLSIVCYSIAAGISLIFGGSFVFAVVYRGKSAVWAYSLALLTSAGLCFLPWLWLHILAKYRRNTASAARSVPDEMLENARENLSKLRSQSLLYRHHPDGERVGLLLERFCHHAERLIREIAGNEQAIRNYRTLWVIYLPELVNIGNIYLQLPPESTTESRRRLLALIADTHRYLDADHSMRRERDVQMLDSRIEALQESVRRNTTAV